MLLFISSPYLSLQCVVLLSKNIINNIFDDNNTYWGILSNSAIVINAISLMKVFLVFLTFSNLASWMSVASFWFLADSLALRREKTFSNYYSPKCRMQNLCIIILYSVKKKKWPIQRDTRSQVSIENFRLLWNFIETATLQNQTSALHNLDNQAVISLQKTYSLPASYPSDQDTAPMLLLSATLFLTITGELKYTHSFHV